MTTTPILNRQQLAQFLPTPEAIKAFEALFKAVSQTVPQANEDAQIAADQAQVMAAEALAGLAEVASLLSLSLLGVRQEQQFEDSYFPPIEQAQQDFYIQPIEQAQQDFYIPPVALGSLAEQNANKVSITGGNIDGVSAGLNNALTYLRVIKALAGEVARFEGDTNSAFVIINQTDAIGVNTLRPVLSFRKGNSTILQLSVGPNGDSYYDATGTSKEHIFNANVRIQGAKLTVGDATNLITSNVAMNNGAAAATGTLTNAPIAGNPTKWIPINDNGTTRYIPTW